MSETQLTPVETSVEPIVEEAPIKKTIYLMNDGLSYVPHETEANNVRELLTELGADNDQKEPIVKAGSSIVSDFDNTSLSANEFYNITRKTQTGG